MEEDAARVQSDDGGDSERPVQHGQGPSGECIPVYRENRADC